MCKYSKLLLIATFSIASCESFVTGIDEVDVTRVSDVDLKLIVVAAEVNYMGFLEGQAARMAGMWSGYFRGADRQYVGFYNYNVTSGTFETEWDNIYIYTLKQLRIAQRKAAAQNNLSTKGICQVMEGSIMGTATALWGDVPYREATNVSAHPNPAYDSQADIIDDLLSLLDEAVINLSSNIGNREGDFLSEGDNSQWIEVAHSVKARLLLYQRNYADALSEAEQGLDNPSEDLLALHGNSLGSDLNLYFDFLEVSRQGTMTAEDTHLGNLLDPNSSITRNHLKTNESGRLAHYYTGSSINNYSPNTSPDGFFFADAAFPLHTAYETSLIAAECRLHLGDVDGAIAELNEHRANLRQMYPSGTYADFVASDFDIGGIENMTGIQTIEQSLLREILEEKWVSLYGQVEAFNELRRTRNALDIPINFGENLPQRFLYTQDEINGNSSIPKPIPSLTDPVEIFK